MTTVTTVTTASDAGQEGGGDGPVPVGAADRAQPVGQAAFPVVGVGASAGGLSAFEAFFSAMPADRDTGMAFVLVQHLSPDHKSILSDLVRRYTRMEVFDVVDGMQVRPNCAYIIPPNRDMQLEAGALRLTEPEAPRGQRLPIDFFFRSLALDQRERAICVVLSGTGSDGTLGVRAVKGEGGLTIAQAPESTEYDGMPRNAIATGLIDFVLPPAEIPGQLLAYVAHAFGDKARPAADAGAPSDEELLAPIFVLLRAQTGKDFSQYKTNTIMRRARRRMAMHQIERFDAYINYLKSTPEEVDLLYHDLLIGVTSFFRDPEVFAALADGAIPRIFAGTSAGSTIRVWVPGCSTGEEAYSLAILLHERNQALRQSHKIQIFATDIDVRAIDAARRGVYPASIAADVSADRLSRFFTQEPDGSEWRVHKAVRDLLIFSEHDLIQAPPFSRLDLISCRNVFIYLNADVQKRLIPQFHYALNPDGFLLLGTSETIGAFDDLFATADRHAKVYERRSGGETARPPARFVPTTIMPQTRLGAATAIEPKPSARELTERTLLQHAPLGALVDADGAILYLHGRSGRYLEPAPGEADLNILKMSREGLKRDLTIALHQAHATRAPVAAPGLQVKTNGDFSTVHLTVRPVVDGGGADLYLVVLEEPPAGAQTVSAAERATTPEMRAGDHDAIDALRRELRAKEEHLGSTRRELETANEELTSSNEELQCTNEELQSTNEEMETSKEELQSVNEELTTVNTEMQQRLHELSRANNDMNNLLAGTGIGTIFVDHDLCIRRFTPAVTAVVNLILSDVGRPIGHIVNNLVGYQSLIEDVRGVLDTLKPREREVQSKAGAWYSLGIRPYRTLDNVVEGAVITFVDISEMRQGREAQRLAVVLRDARDAIMVLGTDGGIRAWNPGAERLYGWSEAEALRMNVSDLVPEPLRGEALQRLAQLVHAEILEPYWTQRKTKQGEVLDIRLTATALVDARGQTYAIATTERRSNGIRAGGAA